MSFGAGFGGVICTQLAQEIADYKGHGRVRIMDRFHAAMIVIPLYSTVFIFYMLNYIFPHLFKYLKSFMEWKDNYVSLTLLKILFIVALLFPLILIIQKKLARLSIWYAFLIFMTTTTTSITTLVIAMAKY